MLTQSGKVQQRVVLVSCPPMQSPTGAAVPKCNRCSQGENNSAGESSSACRRPGRGGHACSYVPKVAATSTYQRTTTQLAVVGILFPRTNTHTTYPTTCSCTHTRTTNYSGLCACTHTVPLCLSLCVATSWTRRKPFAEIVVGRRCAGSCGRCITPLEQHTG